MKKIDLRILEEKWPSGIVSRDKSDDFTGGTIKPKYLANLDSLGLGPKGRFRVGRKIAYPVKNFVKWLEDRAVACE